MTDLAKLKIIAASMSLLSPWSLFAKPAQTGVPVPIGSPADWLNPYDYPAAALRFRMQGPTTFRLAVDETGKPLSCDIVQSSGFDVLDEAACGRLMANARFTPARKSGKAVAGTYQNRVVWRLPDVEADIIGERWQVMRVTLDAAVSVKACEAEEKWAKNGPDLDTACEGFKTYLDPAYAAALRGEATKGDVGIELHSAYAFSDKAKQEASSAVSDYDQAALFVYKLLIGKDGKLSSCALEEQRGDARFGSDLCIQLQTSTFDPPFGALGEKGEASAWQISRVLRKSGAASQAAK